MATKFLDENGLSHFWLKIVQRFGVSASTTSDGQMSASDKTKLDGIESGAEANQNAFSNVTVGSSTIAASAITDTIEFEAGSNITLTPDTTNKKVTIGSSISDATSSISGLMSSSDKTKLDGIATGAEANVQSDWSESSSSSDAYIQNKPMTNKLYTGTCSTAANTASKAVTLDDPTDFSLTAGVKVAVTFTYGSGSGVTPTLNVNSTGAKSIAKAKDETSYQTGVAYTFWGAKETVIFTYSGTYWVAGATGRESYYAKTTLASKANLASPEFTGTPTAPTASAGTNTTQIATTAFVTSAVASAVGGITGVQFSVVQSLPSTGEAGVIYLVSNSGSSPNIYDEYIYVNSSFEKIGTTDVDLSGYMLTSDLVAITNTEIDTIVAENIT